MRLAVGLGLLAGCARQAEPPVEPVLRAQTQALLDAVSHGDARVWDRYLDPDMTYVSEAGTIDSKATLLPQVTPLPPGISGTLVIGSFVVKRHGDVAVVVHEDRETESFFGEPVTAEYLSTDTWRRGREGWRLIARQVHAVNHDPPAVTLTPDELDRFVGTYRLRSSVAYVITREGDHLVGQRSGGGKPVRLAAETRDVLFVAGQPRSRKVFRRGPGGEITGFVDRREGRDIAWTRQPSPSAP